MNVDWEGVGTAVGEGVVGVDTGVDVAVSVAVYEPSVNVAVSDTVSDMDSDSVNDIVSLYVAEPENDAVAVLVGDFVIVGVCERVRVADRVLEPVADFVAVSLSV